MGSWGIRAPVGGDYFSTDDVAQLATSPNKRKCDVAMPWKKLTKYYFLKVWDASGIFRKGSFGLKDYHRKKRI